MAVNGVTYGQMQERSVLLGMTEFTIKPGHDTGHGYFSLVAHLAPYNMKYDKKYAYRYDAWDILSMMLLGIALFKWNVLSAKRSYRF